MQLTRAIREDTSKPLSSEASPEECRSPEVLVAMQVNTGPIIISCSRGVNRRLFQLEPQLEAGYFLRRLLRNTTTLNYNVYRMCVLLQSAQLHCRIFACHTEILCKKTSDLFKLYTYHIIMLRNVSLATVNLLSEEGVSMLVGHY